jgi:hypothetical protein
VYGVLGAAVLVGAWVAGAISHSAGPPILVVGVGYLGFARLERSWPFAFVSAALAVAALVDALSRPVHGDVVLTVAFGLSFTITGLVLHRDDPR